jgi:HlyD family secretion protein
MTPTNPIVRLCANRRLCLIVLGVVIVAIGGAFIYRAYQPATAQAESATPLQTASARRGDLTITASGAGSVIAQSEVSLAFANSGVLTELLVGVGDTVAAGQVLARLQTATSAEAQAANVAAAELAVLTAQQALDQLGRDAASTRANAMANVATYAQVVKDAQYQLDLYTVPTRLSGMTAMEAVTTTGAALDTARADFEPYKYLASSNQTRERLRAVMDQAQADYNAAIQRLEYEYVLEVAQANLKNATDTYEAVKDGPAADDLAIAQAKLTNAQAQLALEKDQAAVEELTAPSAGTILAIAAGVGERVSGALLTLADLSHPLVQVYLDETDLDKVAVGYPAEVTFDALPEVIFNGVVTAVDPSLANSGNVTTVAATVRLDEGYAEQAKGLGGKLPLGLNGGVDVIGGRATDAVLIPIEALRDLGGGSYAVFVVADGTPKLRPVTVGLMDLTSVEITSGLEAGEVVSTGVVATTSGAN